jgi:hypothetical protein
MTAARRLEAVEPEFPQRRLRLHGLRLDYGAALRAYAHGACAAQIALAAGSRATSRRNLRCVGLKIVRRLESRGQIYQTFGQLGCAVEEFCKVVVRIMEATKTHVTQHEGQMAESEPMPDWKAQAAGCDLYMRATGIDKLPLWLSPPEHLKAIFSSRPLEDWEAVATLSGEELDRLIGLARQPTR